MVNEPNFGWNAEFGIYVHWPFCAAKCPYCDFNSHVVRSIDQKVWADAYCLELERARAMTGNRLVSTVFFGGGTPSLMDEAVVGTVIDKIQSLWPMVNNPEITLEANPTSVEAARFQGYRRAGVNRVSLGVQALDDADLKALGRLHTASEAKAALAIANATFDRVSFDLIYARQGQSLSQWEAELEAALQLATGHLSLYQLTIEPGTAFADRFNAGHLGNLPNDDVSADLYSLTQERCDAHGLTGYEISNHATPDNESRHNLLYWQGGDWVGVGPGAHGRIETEQGRLATETYLSPTTWLNAVKQDGSGLSDTYLLTNRQVAEEYVMMGLRLRMGLQLNRLAELDYELSQKKVTELAEMHLVDTNGSSIWITSSGRLLLNEVTRQLLV